VKALTGTGLAWGIPRLTRARDKGKPNILLMLAEDHGLQLSCYGDKHISTPNLDALAEWQAESNDPLRSKHILDKFTAENDATMAGGKYVRKKPGQWAYPEYFFERGDM